MEKDAVISDCGQHRYRLDRRWAEGEICTFVMLNPSTADASLDDPTIRRCIGFAQREGCGALVVINLFSIRATDPVEIARAPYPNGPLAARHSAEVLRAAKGPVICGWGSHAMALGQVGVMTDLIQAAGHAPQCLGTTKSGAPRHPLYIRKDAPLMPFVGSGGPCQ